MNAIDKLHLLAELGESHCELNHGPDADNKAWPAVDYIVLPFGYHDTEVVEVSARELVIPICNECAQALMEEEWTLLYCFECNSSHWVHRRQAKNDYRHHLLWLRGCPDCTNEFGGLYFNDYKGIEADAEFLNKIISRNAA